MIKYIMLWIACYTILFSGIYEDASRAYDKKDFSMALSLYTQSAEQGHKDAQFQLGKMYEEGKGIDADSDQAILWYQKAVQSGHKLAEHNLNKLYFKTKHHSLAYEWYIKHKGHNSPYFVYALGVVFEIGKEVERDYAKAKILYEMASKRGSAKAWYRLGGLYEYNKGVEQNYEKAAYYYNNGAKGGYAQSQFAMGRLYYFGKGVKSNHEKAYKWMNIAKRQGNKDAKRFIIQHSLK